MAGLICGVRRGKKEKACPPLSSEEDKRCCSACCCVMDWGSTLLGVALGSGSSSQKAEGSDWTLAGCSVPVFRPQGRWKWPAPFPKAALKQAKRGGGRRARSKKEGLIEERAHLGFALQPLASAFLRRFPMA